MKEFLMPLNSFGDMSLRHIVVPGNLIRRTEHQEDERRKG